jgi:peptidoglycan/LPS O-acetylase OafA/YrhL
MIINGGLPPDRHMDTKASSAPHVRRGSLDGLRGYAALSVAFYHGILHYDVSLIERVLYRPLLLVDWTELPVKLLLIPCNGESAVIVFFVLSGFVLRGALDRMAAWPLHKTALVFTWRRVVRIYPAVLACMLLFFLLSRVGIPAFPRFTLTGLWQNATLYWPAMHGPSWSVQVEICAVPFLLAAEGARRLWGVLGLMAALFYALVAIEYPLLVARLPALWAYLFLFFIGMLLVERPVAWAVRRLHPAAWVIALTLFLAGRHVTERAAISGLIAQGCAGGLLVACVAHRNDRLSAFLTRPVSRFLGRISYGFYLLNVVALYLCWAAIDSWVTAPAQHPVFWGLVSAVLSVPLTLPMAFLSERFIERPCITAGHALTRFQGTAQDRLLAPASRMAGER